MSAVPWLLRAEERKAKLVAHVVVAGVKRGSLLQMRDGVGVPLRIDVENAGEIERVEVAGVLGEHALDERAGGGVVLLEDEHAQVEQLRRRVVGMRGQRGAGCTAQTHGGPEENRWSPP